MNAGAAERLVWGGLGAVVVVVVAAGLWSLLGSATRSISAQLPVLGEVPRFVLTERSGGTVSDSDLAGEPWVADFIFTQCSGICPILSNRMAELERALRREGLAVRLVSFSVDPARDTPAVLREYADRFGADPGRWLFLTGERAALYRLIGEGFRLSVAERSAEAAADDGGELITHSDRFVLVDGSLRIRGYYHGTEPDAVERVLEDLGRLGESPGAG
jgi:protein SCO1/2